MAIRDRRALATVLGAAILLAAGGLAFRAIRAADPIEGTEGRVERPARAGEREAAAPTGPALAPAPSPDASKRPAPGSSPASDRIEGTVVDAREVPIAGASVEVRDRPGSPALSDAAGRFVLQNPGGASARLRAWAAGKVQANPWLAYDGSPVRVVLVPGCAVNVTVRRAADDGPLAGARVQALWGEVSQYHETWLRPAPFASEGRTDDAGVAALLAPEGSARLFVTAPGFAPAWTGSLHVPPDGLVTEVRLEAGGRVAGRVLDPQERGVGGVKVHVVVLHHLFEAFPVSEEDGRFTLTDVPVAPPGEKWPGTVLATAHAEGWAPAVAEEPCPAPGKEVVLVLRLDPGRTVEGVVLDGDRRPVSGAVVAARPRGRWSESEQLKAAPHRTTSQADGRFRLERVAAGMLGVEAYRETPLFHVGVEVPIPATGDVPFLELVGGVPRGTARLDVRVVDPAGAPLPEAWVVLQNATAEGSPLGLERQRTDTGGTVAFTELASQRLHVVVSHERFPEHAATVDLGNPTVRAVEIRMAGGRMRGRLLHRDGRPARATVALVATRPWDPRTTGVYGPLVDTDAEGRFTFEGLDERAFHFDISDPPLELWRGPRTFRAGADTTWTVVHAGEAAPRAGVEIVDAATNEPVPHLRVDIDQDGWAVAPLEDAARGFHALEGTVQPGPTAVRIRRHGFAEHRVEGVVLGGDGPPPRLRVTFDPGAVVAGNVVSADGEPVRDAVVTVAEWIVDISEPEGSYRLNGLPEGDVEVEVRGRYVLGTVRRTVRASRGSSESQDIQVPIAAALWVTAPADAPLAAKVEVKLTASDGTEVARARVTPEQWKRAELHKAGRVLAVLESVPPGTVSLAVTWDGRALPAVEVKLQGGRWVEKSVDPR